MLLTIKTFAKVVLRTYIYIYFFFSLLRVNVKENSHKLHCVHASTIRI